ncbi:choice-of-anchor F family protein [Sulfurovum sp. TSL1]|uniref:choice-of-anchor F family protein n=1 Tax=Sulfurovum sp. TSL1 TaxID=2826994 RepID=UPI001CC75708|nr:choice-of-anchor F family protein [Sulfurovum sp. TSL1]GIT97798.1 hypothetical protein TSL1_06190 [Sulfurovum sp. TSL1]
MKTNMVKTSLIAAMLLGSSAYAGLIKTDADISDYKNTVIVPSTQFGFGGWNLDNVNVKIVSIDDFSTALDGTDFNKTTGEYSEMSIGMSFESEISTGGEIRGLLHGKDWPVGEPAGIKVINGDVNVSNGKPENCIINTSYIGEDLNDSASHFLNDTDPLPVICSSPFQTHKRFKVNMQSTSVANYNTTTRYGQPIDLVFNLDTEDLSNVNTRYQVFSKINNYTGMRLDGYKIEVIKADGTADDNLTLSIGLLENNTTGTPEDIWDEPDMANFSHGLWGPKDKHFPTDGFFDSKRAGFVVDRAGHNTPTLVGGPTTLGSNYEALFGMWLPSKWAPYGIFYDHDSDPLTDADLVAFWGTAPDAAEGTAPAWHKGQADNWAEPTAEELDAMNINEEGSQYSIGVIEDTLNLGLNYIVNVGNNQDIDGKFTIRITPRVAADQTAPSYIDANGDPILPPELVPAPTTTVVSSGGGGGCTYNPDSKNFDMMFLVMMALGLLYPFRRRFIK